MTTLDQSDADRDTRLKTPIKCEGAVSRVMPFAAKSVQGRQQTSSGLEICCIQSLCKLS